MDQVELKRCKHEKKGSSFVVLHYSLETHSLIQIAPVPCHTQGDCSQPNTSRWTQENEQIYLRS
jgi:hypothetical protein